MKVVNVGEALILETLVDELLTTAVLHLYQNNVTVTGATVIEDLTEADYSGYDPIALDVAGNVWGGVVVEGDGRVSSTGDTDIEFVREAGATSNSVYGSYLTDAAGELLGVQPRLSGGVPAPFVMDVPGNTVRITPYFSVQSRDEIAGGPLLLKCRILSSGDAVRLDFLGTVVADIDDEFTLFNGSETVDLEFDSQPGPAELSFTASRTMTTADTGFVLNYAGGAVTDLGGAELPAFGGFGVLNGSEVAP